ncbi:MAG: SUMF1/EgtB/PvdO family nonheme iron enzyme [Verrucomicrobiota bacterium]|nr:SUMF1/EgtB/PvdO family nonheme iron enzyme [Verrucomicrobiota bacterium]
MKLIFAVLTGLTLTMVSLIAQETAGVASATDGSTNKVALEDLLKLPGFTNHAGMVLVKLSDSQWIGAYEVRQAEYQEVAGSNPSAFPGASHPVESVSWTEAMAFCARLTEAEKTEKMLPEGFAYTLPTQAQWEGFAASAELKDAVTSANGTRSGTASVGSLGATGPGVYDIRGNVWEWCLDPQDKPFRVARGAAWNSWIDINLRREFRWYGEPDVRQNSIGFRCLLVKSGAK